MSDDRKIYAADLAAYNAGVLHGVWVDVTDPETMQTEIAGMLRESPEPNVQVTCPRQQLEDKHEGCGLCHGSGMVPSAEEWLVHDYDGDWHGINLGETSDLEAICETDRLLEEHGEAWGAYVGIVGEHYATESGFEESYSGEWASAEDFAEETANEIHGDLGPLGTYIDWERYARDLGFDGFHFVNGGRGVYVFRDC